jgi:hypothetical protein
MPVQPFEGLSDSFAKGAATGQNYAQMQLQTELRRQSLEETKAQHQASREQHEQETGKWIFEQIDKIGKTSIGKARAVRVKAFGDILEQQFGMKRPEVLEAMLVDEAGLALTQQFVKQVTDPRTPSEVLAKTYVQLLKNVDNPDIEAMMKEYGVKHGELINTVERESQQRRTKSAQSASDQETLRQNIDNVTKDYARVEGVTQTINSIMAKGAKALSGADDFQLLKAFNQYNDTAAVREGETAFVQSLQSLTGRVSSLIANWKEGDKLDPTLRQEIKDTAQRIGQVSRGMEVDRITPYREAIRAQGLDEKQFLKPRQMAMFKQLEAQRKKQAADPVGPPEAPNGKKPETPKPSPQDVLRTVPCPVKAALMRLKQMGKNRATIKAELEKRNQSVTDDVFDAMGIK